MKNVSEQRDTAQDDWQEDPEKRVDKDDADDEQDIPPPEAFFYLWAEEDGPDESEPDDKVDEEDL